MIRGIDVERVRDFDRLGDRPVVLEGALAGTKAVRTWSFARFAEVHGDAEVSVRLSQPNAPQLFAGDPRRAFSFEKRSLARAIADLESGPVSYVQLCDLNRTLPKLASDLSTPRWVGTVLRSPAYVWIAGQRTVNPLHFDFNHVLLGQIVGRKRFVLFSPDDSAHLAGPIDRTIHRTTALDLERPDRAQFPRLERATPFEATIGPGDLLFIPYRWWHGMVSLDPSISVSWWWEPSLATHARDTLRTWAANAVRRWLR